MKRQGKFTEKLADEICRRIAEGETLSQICRDDHMPVRRAVYDWMEARKDFAARFARAREFGFDVIAEETLKIADTPVEGVEIEEDGEKTKISRKDMLGHRRLQIDTRLKLLAKWSPDKYGERQTVDMNVNTGLADRLARARARAKDE